MTNRLRTQIEEEEAEKKLIVEEKPNTEFPDNFLTQLFTKGIFNAEAATNALPFILFIAFLGMIYIANMHLAERNIRVFSYIEHIIECRLVAEVIESCHRHVRGPFVKQAER